MENKPIMDVLDTDELREYIEANKEMLGLATDSDGNEIPAAKASMVLDKVVADSLNHGELRTAIAELLKTRVGYMFMDMVYETVDEWTYDKVNEVMKQA
jgi:hypothetical protein